MRKILVQSNKYNGQYVAIKSANDNTIVGAGNTPEEALAGAKKREIQNPFLIYVPERGLVHI